MGKLRDAAVYAKENSSCKKARVGCVIVDTNNRSVYGANRVIPNECDAIFTIADNFYSGSCNKGGHCVATIHSEIDAITRAARVLYRATIYVTRYPCENCARAIVAAGIGKVVYGRPQPISDETARIFEWGKVEVIHESEFTESDANG